MASCGVRVTSTLLLTQPLGAETSVLGAVLSILTGTLVALVVFPALSETDAEAVWPSPSVDRTESTGLSPEGRDRGSSADQVCVTSVLYQPFLFGLVVAAALRFGAVLSMLMPLTAALALLPALSTAVPSTVWLAPWPRCWGPVTVSMPDRSSVPLKDTVTSSEYQPAALAARSGAPVMAGAVLSMLTVAVPLTLLPALSVAVPVTFWALPSVVTVWGSVQSFRPDRFAWSTHEKLTATSVLFQPLAFWSGDWLGVTLGEERSTLTVKAWASSLLPALSTDQYSTVWTPSAPTVTVSPFVGVVASSTA